MKRTLSRLVEVAAVFLVMMTFLPSLFAATLGDPATTSINALGIDLLRKTCKPDANALLSPYSIQSALAMAYAGSEGATREEMAKALHYPKDEKALHSSFAGLRAILEDAVQRSEKNTERMRQSMHLTNDALVLSVANRLFGQSGYDFRAPFLKLLNDTYAAPFEELDFKKAPSQAARHINAWVETQTRQRIRNIIPEGALDDLTRLVLVNAIYLKAPWAEPFDVSATQSGTFYVNGSQRVEVPMMTQRSELAFARGDGFVAVSLSITAPLRFVIFLPDKRDGLAQLEKQLSSDMLAGKLKWDAGEVTLFLPRFRLEPPVLSLSEALQTLGLKTAFDVPRGSANFDRIAPRRPDDYLAISDVFHKTFLNLDEKGIEAAAATAIRFYAAGIHQQPKPVEVRVDHPFLFAIIRDGGEGPGTCLFLGHVTDPR